MLELDSMQRRIEEKCRTVPVDCPWTAEVRRSASVPHRSIANVLAQNAREMDGMTTETWKLQTIKTEAARGVFDAAVRVRSVSVSVVL
jgi:hypothetical protein